MGSNSPLSVPHTMSFKDAHFCSGLENAANETAGTLGRRLRCVQVRLRGSGRCVQYSVGCAHQPQLLDSDQSAAMLISDILYNDEEAQNDAERKIRAPARRGGRFVLSTFHVRHDPWR